MPDKSLWKYLTWMMLLFFQLLTPRGVVTAEDGAQRIFASPEDAQQGLIKAVKTKDLNELRHIFGPIYNDLDPGDPVQQASELNQLAKHLDQGVALIKEGDVTVALSIGEEKWPFPVPLVKSKSGWLFDTKAGRDEILDRRIGRNEILASNACRAYAEAQMEYYTMEEPDGVQIPKYAQYLISSPGRRDGLYWPTLPGAEESPLGPLLAKAGEAGYEQKAVRGENGLKPFYGYYFRILKGQGPSAPGGKFNYVINGNMVAGHALLAYPARWGASGIMTFIVNQRGRVYQKNLGPRSAEKARAMKAYNPDMSWKLVVHE